MLLLFHDNKVGKTEGCTLIQGNVCSRNSHVAVIYNFVEGAGLHKMQNDSKCRGSALPQSKRNHLGCNNGNCQGGKTQLQAWGSSGAPQAQPRPREAPVPPLRRRDFSPNASCGSEGMSSAPREGPDGHRTTQGKDRNGLRNYLCCRQTPASSKPQHSLLLTNPNILRTTEFPAPDKPQHPLIPKNQRSLASKKTEHPCCSQKPQHPLLPNKQSIPRS